MTVIPAEQYARLTADEIEERQDELAQRFMDYEPKPRAHPATMIGRTTASDH
ncbi:hypothetical protein [uncultured Arthrobacter sp.]|uniref:hypothetical protein n=1 Tax=uncultured Arthrobacter sp. TaxID=114050 RepID=UPI0025DEB15F|nr:hypothetical protein [uncultured Arthrobacter sp.]